jgi:GTP pyrophosphokinase
MHLDAEFGPASHWAYKKARHSNFDKDYIKRVDWFPKNIPLQSTQPAEKFFEEISNSLFQERIYVFTPRGDVQTLPADSTSVDFAFNIHSEIGESCVGARVNGVIKPLDYKLQSGEIVEILTKKGRKPNPLWLNFVKSSHARNHIKNYLNKQKEAFYAAKGDPQIESTPPPHKEQPKPNPKAKKQTKTPKKKRLEMVIGGEIDIPYKLATCCQPNPGKDVVAYKSRGLDYTVHEANCKMLETLESERFMEAHFRLEAHFQIKAHDRVGLLRDYTTAIANQGLNILDAHFTFTKDHKNTAWTFTVECGSDRETEELLSKLQKVPDVFTIKRLTK